MKVLIVVDMQNDFIDGALGTNEAVLIVDNVVNKINEFDGKVIFTRDTHGKDYLDTQEGKNLPIEHCIKDTIGWQISSKITVPKDSVIIDKPTFGSTELGELLTKINESDGIDEISIIGLCTDICVISNAMIIKAFLPEIPIVVDSSCCAGVSVESHNVSLEAMKVCQIEVV